MKKLQKYLDFLLEKYMVNTDAKLKSTTVVCLDGKEYPIFPHRLERRFTELKGIVNGGTLEGVSVMRTFRIVEKGTDLYDELYRELDICRFVLNKELVAITVMKNDNVMNVIATAEDGIVCTIEISATLAKGEIAKDKHEVIAQRGTACDVVVDAQLRQDSIYVFGKNNAKYTDTDFELYGLDADNVAVVRAAFAAAQSENRQELIDNDARLCALIKAAKTSEASGKREVL